MTVSGDAGGWSRTVRWVGTYLASSIGRKQVLGVAGALLVAFLAGHMAGNLSLLNPDPAAAQAAYNAYCQFLTGLKPLIWFVEAGLAAILFVHVALALVLTLGNRRARGAARYAVVSHAGQATGAAYTMFASGVVILVFLVQHLVLFKFGRWYLYRNAADEIVRDMWLTTVETFANPVWTALYVAALLVAGAHLVHALPSLFRTFGLVHPRWTPLLNAAGVCVAGAILGGFIVTAAGTCALAHRPVTQAQIEKARAAQPALEAQVAAQAEGGRK